MNKLLVKKFTDLNKASMHSMEDGSNASIIKNFTEESIKLLNADFGFAWGKLDSEIYELIYKSPDTPYPPRIEEKRDNTHMISIRYGDHVYGSIVLGYNNPHNFTEEELMLSDTIGDTIAHMVTINWLVEKEQKALALVEKQKETEVLLAQEKLKTEFIANAVHEFRTPLAIMRGNVELALLDKNHNIKSAERALKITNEEIQHLSGLLMDLAVLTSPKENRKQMLHLVEIDIGLYLKELTERLKVLIKNKKISLKITGSASKSIIKGDKKYLEKLFMNLIRNAILYGKEKGHVTVDIKKDKDTVTVEVIDDGVGITKEELPRVFERFFRTEKAREMSDIGTGLGLAISKWVVDAHGGTIGVESIEGKGTTFTVVLPIK